MDFLVSLYRAISGKENAAGTIKKNQHLIDRVIPSDIIFAVDELVKSDIPFEAFKTGKEDKASFWIRMKDEFILIRYFALRDHEGKYKGVIEVSQEVSEIRDLKGEKMLLDWT